MFNFDQTTTTDSVISARDLRKTFGSGRAGGGRSAGHGAGATPPAAPAGAVEAVRGVSMEIARGEIFGFLGPNGAGKTTTLRMLTTLLPIDGGSATVAGFDVSSRGAEVRERIGYVSQLGGSDELATGRENLVLQARLYGADAAEAARRADELIELLDLGPFADRRVMTYSGGQRRRLDVALGIAHEPVVLFLDEPSTGLDPQNRANLWSQIRMLRDRGTTVFLTTHYLEEADELCDRVMIIDQGRIVAEGSPAALKRAVAGDLVLLTIQDANGATDRAGDQLRSQPFVRELTVDGPEVRLYVEDGGAAIPVILRLLDQHGIGLKAMSLSEPTLDDVFLRQTGRSLRDGGETTTHLEQAA